MTRRTRVKYPRDSFVTCGREEGNRWQGYWRLGSWRPRARREHHLLELLNNASLHLIVRSKETSMYSIWNGCMQSSCVDEGENDLVAEVDVLREDGNPPSVFCFCSNCRCRSGPTYSRGWPISPVYVEGDAETSTWSTSAVRFVAREDSVCSSTGSSDNAISTEGRGLVQKLTPNILIFMMQCHHYQELDKSGSLMTSLKSRN